MAFRQSQTFASTKFPSSGLISDDESSIDSGEAAVVGGNTMNTNHNHNHDVGNNESNIRSDVIMEASHRSSMGGSRRSTCHGNISKVIADSDSDSDLMMDRSLTEETAYSSFTSGRRLFGGTNSGNNGRKFNFIKNRKKNRSNTNTGRMSTSNNEVSTLAKKHTRRISCMKVSFLVLLFSLVIAMSLLVYFKTSQAEDETFSMAFDAGSCQLIEAFTVNFRQTLTSTDSLGIHMTSHAASPHPHPDSMKQHAEDDDENHTRMMMMGMDDHNNGINNNKDGTTMDSAWPYVTMPDFDMRGRSTSQIRRDSTPLLMTMPIVPTTQKQKWENYVKDNQWWIEQIQSRQQQQQQQQEQQRQGEQEHHQHNSSMLLYEHPYIWYLGVDEKFHTEPDIIHETVNGSDTTDTTATTTTKSSTGDDFYFPVWQTEPLITKMINWNLLSHPAFKMGMKKVIESGGEIVLCKVLDDVQDGTSSTTDETNQTLTMTMMDSHGRHAEEEDDDDDDEEKEVAKSYHPHHNNSHYHTNSLGMILDEMEPTFQYNGEPLTILYFPLFDSFDIQTRKLVGIIAEFVFFPVFFQNILPDNGENIYHVILENSCGDGQNFTFKVNGPNVEYLGNDDMHDTKFDDYSLSSSSSSSSSLEYAEFSFHDLVGTKSNTDRMMDRYGRVGNVEDAFELVTQTPWHEGYCNYRLRVYPTTEMEDKFITNRPKIFAFLTALTFFITALIFTIYDCFVERRQSTVMETAVASSAIVSSIFPEVVRDRLYYHQNAAKRSDNNNTNLRHGKNNNKNKNNSNSTSAVHMNNNKNNNNKKQPSKTMFMQNHPHHQAAVVDGSVNSNSNNFFNGISRASDRTLDNGSNQQANDFRDIALVPNDSTASRGGGDNNDDGLSTGNSLRVPASSLAPSPPTSPNPSDTSVAYPTTPLSTKIHPKRMLRTMLQLPSSNGSSSSTTSNNNHHHQTNTNMIPQPPNLLDRSNSAGAGLSTIHALTSSTSSSSRTVRKNFDLAKPIADLWTDCTVLFADIAGFTAWSSQREPDQVFLLLQNVYQAFDEVASKLRVFKVETIGDCYVAVTGLPDPQEDHAIRMTRFAREIMVQMGIVTAALEVILGPETGELCMRVGLHSGPVIAGVLRGEKSRFQLFGDTVNRASRMESTGKRKHIQLSQATADLLVKAGKGSWITKREDLVHAKGMGEVQTYWAVVYRKTRSNTTARSSSDHTEDRGPPGQATTMTAPTAATTTASVVSVANSLLIEDRVYNKKRTRLIDWHVDTLGQYLKRILAMRESRSATTTTTETDAAAAADAAIAAELIMQTERGRVLDEVAEVIVLPQFKGNMNGKEVEPSHITLDKEVLTQLRDYISCIAKQYRVNPFHSFEHASHVTLSATKLLKRIVIPEAVDLADAADVHNYTYGITSDPLTQFAVVLSALIHDVEHSGVPNQQLARENPNMAEVYGHKSIAEQNSVDVAWNLLMDPCYKELQNCIFADEEELRRFRQLIVNSVMATDIFDKDMKRLRESRWAKAFSDNPGQNATDLKATIVIEHIIQAADVAHTMQHWHIYQKWNRRLFEEMYSAYQAGRSTKDPSVGWYKGELWFFDNYVIPLAKKLDECKVFGVSSDECLNYAMDNRKEWNAKGKDIVQEMTNKCKRVKGFQ